MMNTTAEQKSSRFLTWFRICPIRHVLSFVGLAVIGAYFVLRSRQGVMQALSDRFVRPWHRAMSRVCGLVSFSVAELLIAIAVIAAIVYIIFFIVRMARNPQRLLHVYRFFLTCLTAFALIYGGFCLLWGAYYYSADFEDQSGIRGAPASVEQLTAVTRYFTDLLNQYDAQICRDEAGHFAQPLDDILDASPQLYSSVEKLLPCLSGAPLRAKPVFFSRVMSYTNFTGFFFPFTGEANINVDSPACYIPSTIAHELAHQRGVAEEDEANFVAVLASLESGDPVYCYSACLLAYTHLGNALHSADYDAWLENYERLADGPRTDLSDNNQYWAKYETPVSTVSDRVYTGFLQSYGQTLGLKTYGKCVDLLIAYYFDKALEAIP